MKSRRPTWVACVALVAACSMAPGRPTDTEDTAPPATSLSPQEQDLAKRLAATARSELAPPKFLVEGAKVTKEVVAGVAPYPATDETDRRNLAAVTSFNYATGSAVRVVVDLGGERVVETRVLPGPSAPAAPEEKTRVRELLEADSNEYQALFQAPVGAYDLGFFISSGTEDGGLEGHRIVLVRPVYFRSAPDAPIAIVDLTADRVLRYED